MKKTKVSKLKQFKHKFDCMLCTILGHDQSKSLNNVNVDMVTKRVLVVGVLAKVASQAPLYNQWASIMNAEDAARNFPIGQM